MFNFVQFHVGCKCKHWVMKVLKFLDSGNLDDRFEHIPPVLYNPAKECALKLNLFFSGALLGKCPLAIYIK